MVEKLPKYMVRKVRLLLDKDVSPATIARKHNIPVASIELYAGWTFEAFGRTELNDFEKGKIDELAAKGRRYDYKRIAYTVCAPRILVHDYLASRKEQKEKPSEATPAQQPIPVESKKLTHAGQKMTHARQVERIFQVRAEAVAGNGHPKPLDPQPIKPVQDEESLERRMERKYHFRTVRLMILYGQLREQYTRLVELVAAYKTLGPVKFLELKHQPVPPDKQVMTREACSIIFRADTLVRRIATELQRELPPQYVAPFRDSLDDIMRTCEDAARLTEHINYGK